MLEASNENQNGGIFSLPVDFSLLSSPPDGKKPNLVQKFGTWSTDEENFLKSPVHFSSNKGMIGAINVSQLYPESNKSTFPH